MFHEIRFPTSIAFHSTGGPERKTEIVTLGSGYEERNGVWAASRRRYDVGYGVKTLDDIAAVTAFFEARSGRLYGFRFQDFADFKSASPAAAVTAFDQQLGTGSNGTIVYAGKFDGREVAIKAMLVKFYDVASQETKLLRESDDHSNGKHPLKYLSGC